MSQAPGLGTEIEQRREKARFLSGIDYILIKESTLISASFWWLLAFPGWWPCPSHLHGHHLQISSCTVLTWFLAGVSPLPPPPFMHVIAFRVYADNVPN